MQFKKILISATVMAVIYLVVSYLFTLLFKQEFRWLTRILMAAGFGILVTLLQVSLAKTKKRRK